MYLEDFILIGHRQNFVIIGTFIPLMFGEVKLKAC